MVLPSPPTAAAPAPEPPRAPWATQALGGLVTIALAALLTLSICDMNRLGLLVLITVPMLTLVLLNVEFGLYCLLVYSSIVAFLIRMLPPANSGPIGLALDVLLLLMGARLLLDLAQRRDWQIFATPLTVPVLVFVGFQAVEVFNPAAPSIVFGLYGLRVTARILGFFLVLYYMRRAASIRRFVAVWLTLMFAVGLYGIFQHHHGLLWQEMHWLLTEGNAQTHILNGYVRVFSTVGDAATFGFLEVLATLLLFALALTARGATQLLLLAATLPMLYAMTVSYSRGPVVALAAGAAMLVVASRNWRLGIGVAAVGVVGLALLTASGSTKLVDRLSTATNPTEDASFNVRMGYITTYVPEIAKRPFGYGINTSGGGGKNVANGEAVRNSVVGIPTDNYYFKVALEMGWVGLGLFLWLHTLALWHTYRIYARARDPYHKALALGLLSVLFCLFVGAFSNDIHAQKPIAEFFWIALGLAMLLGQLESAAAPRPAHLPARLPSRLPPPHLPPPA